MGLFYIPFYLLPMANSDLKPEDKDRRILIEVIFAVEFN